MWCKKSSKTVLLYIVSTINQSLHHNPISSQLSPEPVSRKSPLNILSASPQSHKFHDWSHFSAARNRHSSSSSSSLLVVLPSGFLVLLRPNSLTVKTTTTTSFSSSFSCSGSSSTTDRRFSWCSLAWARCSAFAPCSTITWNSLLGRGGLLVWWAMSFCRNFNETGREPGFCYEMA